MWLAGLHVPESYLTAIIQMACRKNEWSLDYSTMYTTVTQYVNEDEIDSLPETVKCNVCTISCTLMLHITHIIFSYILVGYNLNFKI